MSGTYEAYIAGTIPFEHIHKDMGVKQSEYKRVRNPFMFYRSIVIVHERKYLWVFWLLNHLLLQRIKIVYIHHNIFSNLRRASIMPHTASVTRTQTISQFPQLLRKRIETWEKQLSIIENSSEIPEEDNAKRLQLAGKNVTVTIPSLTKGQTVTIVFASTGDNAVTFDALTNLSGASGFTAADKNTTQTGTATVTNDGAVSFASTGGSINIFSIKVEGRPEHQRQPGHPDTEQRYA